MVEIYGERVYEAKEAAKMLGISVDEFRAKAGWGSGWPAVRGPVGFVGLRQEHLDEWRRRLHPQEDPDYRLLSAKTWRGDRFVEDPRSG